VHEGVDACEGGGGIALLRHVPAVQQHTDVVIPVQEQHVFATNHQEGRIQQLGELG